MKTPYLILLLLSGQLLLFAQEVPFTSTLATEYDSLQDQISDTIDHTRFFGRDEPLELTLKYDISRFRKEKMKGKYLDAELTIHYPGEESVVKNIRLKARGNFRREKCNFPPIYLNFKTDPIQQTELKGLKKVKIVTHCHHSRSSQTYILREYLAYRLYNVISPLSFRVRLVDIRYIDTGKRGKDYREYGFVIEPLELVASRNNSVVVNSKLIRGENVRKDNADQVALYEYMIGNTDWRFHSGHNIKYVKSLDEFTDQVIAIPYDFDFSGFVNTGYSFPQSWASIDNVREREYLGYCRSDPEDYLSAIRIFELKKDEMKERVLSFPFIDEREKKYLIRYLDEFNHLLSRPGQLTGIMSRECRTNF